MTSHPDPTRSILDSDANVGEDHGLAGSMGVSSERVGKVSGDPSPATHGAESTAAEDAPPTRSESEATPSRTPEPNPEND